MRKHVQITSPLRSATWNYGGERWKLSRTKIENFLECPRCFYLNNVLGIKRPSSPPFNLNKAVDQLLKQEFDVHRAKGEQHPLQKAYGIDARPVAHEKLDLWRENFDGVEVVHKPTGLRVSGAIDDLWQDADGNYLVVDYKATAKSEPVTALDQPWHDGYKRQAEVYQWLLRQNGLRVSNTAYFVYCTGRPDEKAFDAKLHFDVHLIPYEGNDEWVEPTLKKIKRTLVGKKIPTPSATCEFCLYRNTVDSVLAENNRE